MLINLPDFDKTLVNLAMNLLRAPEEFSAIILTEPDIQGAVSGEAMRVTLHYILALLAYGFPAEDEVLKEAARWLLTPAVSDQLDETEMYRLEGLLRLRPYDPTVPERLAKLVKQRTADGLFVIQTEPTQHDTLWGLKVLTRAWKEGVLDTKIITLDELRHTIDSFIQPGFPDKDLALALRLRFELWDKQLSPPLERLLEQRLLDSGRKNGLWDLTQNALWISDRMRQEFSVQDIQQHYKPFCRAIQSTCVVVENLAVMMNYYTDIQPVLRQSLDLWWEAFHTDHVSDDPAGKMRALFIQPPDYLMSLSLTLMALRAFVNEPLIYRGAAYVHRQMLDYQVDQTAPSEKENLKQALRRCFQIDIEGEPQRLTLGLSGAGVARVELKVRSPLTDNFIFSESLVVKYGPTDEIDLERKNYERVPDTIRNCFVNFPAQDTYFDPEQQRAYIVMPDLHGYRTLYEYYLRGFAAVYPGLIKHLGAFLLRVHQARGYQREFAPRGILYDIYLLPMQQNLALSFNYLWQNKLLAGEDGQHHASLLHQKLVEQLADLTRFQFQLERFPAAFMHGDMHTRNIMIRRSASASSSEMDLDFKLIDLEKARVDGDLAMDIGQLTVDARVLVGEAGKTAAQQSPLQQVVRHVEMAYQEFALERQDKHFEARFELAKARSYIRIAKGKTRQIDQHLRMGKRGLAIDTARAMLSHLEQSARHLQGVLKTLNQPVA